MGGNVIVSFPLTFYFIFISWFAFLVMHWTEKKSRLDDSVTVSTGPSEVTPC